MSERPAEPPAARLPYWEFVTLVALLMALNAMAIDVILPALQQMGESLSVADENTRQLPLTAYVVVFGISQLVYGTVSDRFGRRRVLLVGLVIYVIGCVGSAFSDSFAMLLATRGLQGLGAGATRVIAIAIIRDTFGGRRMASVMSLAMMVFMAIPIIAPGVGQIILMISGWRAILGFIAIFGVVVTVWCYLRLPETLAPADKRELRIGPIAEAFWIVVTNRVAAGYALATGLIFGCLFAYLNSAQQIFQQEYKLGALFPLAFSSAAVLIAVASFTNSRLVERFGMRRLSHTALVGFTFVSALLSIAAILNGGHVPFWMFYGANLLTFCLFAFIGTNFNALAMDPLGHVAGTASSVLSSVQTMLGGFLGALVGLAYDDTVLPLSLGFVAMSAASFVVIALTERQRLFGRTAPAEANA
jgi:DHA1 family bicyclomycin/chloramphenicol resistance-like MFS transporter